MNFVPTMALEINEKTYPIAVACLPPVFATIPFKDVDGHYLVINRLEARRSPKNKTQQTLTVGNSWMRAEQFKKTYATDFAMDISFTFVRVERISR